MQQPLTEILTKHICDNPQILIDDLGLDLTVNRDSITGPCYIHNSDNNHSFILYLDSGIFRCFTNNCHTVFKNSCLGFVRGVLSNRHCRWSKSGDYIYNWDKTLDYLCNLYGVKERNNNCKRNKEVDNFIKCCQNEEKKESRFIMTRDYYLKSNSCPSQYFIDRGFSKEILTQYDVFSCSNENKPFYRRSIVPVYEDDHKTIIGISARSEIGEEPRWTYTKKFPSATNLYPLWRATPFIKKERKCVIVESPANVWKINMAGIDNVVCIWSALGWNDYKRYTLDKLGVMKLIVVLDNDEAGEAGREKIRKEVGRFYNIVDLILPDSVNDVADMNVEQVKELFKIYI